MLSFQVVFQKNLFISYDCMIIVLESLQLGVNVHLKPQDGRQQSGGSVVLGRKLKMQQIVSIGLDAELRHSEWEECHTRFLFQSCVR